jgi:hypothetical protein
MPIAKQADICSSSAEDSWKQVFKLSVPNVSYFGSDVSIDNDVLVVGATGDALVDDSGTGATYVYRRDASSPVWIQEAKLVANDNKAYILRSVWARCISKRQLHCNGR